jgi:hypothetical protein
MGERTISDTDLQAIVTAIDERIEFKFKTGHMCRYTDNQFVQLGEFLEWWHENKHTMQSMAEFWDSSKKWWLGTIWAGLVGMLVWGSWMIFHHGFKPPGK